MVMSIRSPSEPMNSTPDRSTTARAARGTTEAVKRVSTASTPGVSSLP